MHYHILWNICILLLVSPLILGATYRTAYTYESTNCAPSSLSAVRAVLANTLPTCIPKPCTPYGNRAYMVLCEDTLPSYPSDWAFWKVYRNQACGQELTDLAASPLGVCAFWWFEGTNNLAAAKLICTLDGKIKNEKYAFDPSCGYMDYLIQPISVDQCVVSTDQYHVGMSFHAHCSGAIPPTPQPSLPPPIPQPSPPSTCGIGCTSSQCNTCQGQGNSCCGGACYSTAVFDCLNGALCPKGQHRCGQACYNPAVYHCSNGVLQYGPESGTPPPPPPPIPQPTIIPPPPSGACVPCSQQGLSCCGNGQCYSSSVYRCWNNSILCPAALQACGEACYDPNVYNCSNGNLVHR